jgi:hypothetical protein
MAIYKGALVIAYGANRVMLSVDGSSIWILLLASSTTYISPDPSTATPKGKQNSPILLPHLFLFPHILVTVPVTVCNYKLTIVWWRYPMDKTDLYLYHYMTARRLYRRHNCRYSGIYIIYDYLSLSHKYPLFAGVMSLHVVCLTPFSGLKLERSRMARTWWGY